MTAIFLTLLAILAVEALEVAVSRGARAWRPLAKAPELPPACTFCGGRHRGQVEDTIGRPPTPSCPHCLSSGYETKPNPPPPPPRRRS